MESSKNRPQEHITDWEIEYVFTTIYGKTVSDIPKWTLFEAHDKLIEKAKGTRKSL